MYWIDPIADPRWTQLIERHPQASVFHTVSWLKALRRTYKYRPIALISSPSGAELKSGIAFCEVNSWLSPSRLVSLPFSDHCQPLLENDKDMVEIASFLSEHCGRSCRWEYVEVRPAGELGFKRDDLGVLPTKSSRCNESTRLGSDGFGSRFEMYQEYSLHKIDLRCDLDTLFSNLHNSSIKRKIRRAEREGLEHEAGRSETNLEKFYRLLLLTRRRHGLPPQPMMWFRNLNDCFGASLTIHIASKDGRPIAAILTLRFKDTLVYKYGCSDAGFHSLGAMPMLFWKVIQEGKQHGAKVFDLGRSDISNPGLIAFKQHLGASCCELRYFRLGHHRTTASAISMYSWVSRNVFTRIPSRLAQLAGSALYRHMG
jgi:CelD/BcsL family acetyltransferase involved in cellulose biosynthesis